MKKSQLIMIWFLPLIVIGGLYWPILGILVVMMMAFFLPLSFFKSRYWCWNLCPRGAFLDIVMSRFSLNKNVPRIFTRPWFRWLVFVLFLSFLIVRIIRTGGDLIAIAIVFVSMCILTTLLSVIIGVFTRHRGWCAICPMGTLQQKLGEWGRKVNKPADKINH